MLAQLRPKAHEAYRTLPVLGPIVDGFTDWVHRCGYSMPAFNSLLGHGGYAAHWGSDESIGQQALKDSEKIVRERLW